VTDKRDRISTDPGLGPIEPPGPSTLRSLEVVEDAGISPNAPVYYEPLPLVAVSNHKTLEIETVKLAEDIDPRKLVTELRLHRPPAFIPASDSGWPPETALSSSQPPAGPVRRWRTPVVLLSLLAALLLLVLARAVSRRSTAGAVSAAHGALSAAPAAPVALLPASAATQSSAPVAPVAVTAPSIASVPDTAPTDPVAAPAGPVAAATAAAARAPLAPPHLVKQSPPPSASNASLAAPSASKPKRAIY
jgi:hypothetical protein